MKDQNQMPFSKQDDWVGMFPVREAWKKLLCYCRLELQLLKTVDPDRWENETLDQRQDQTSTYYSAKCEFLLRVRREHDGI